jgi:hypothetical protein
MPKASSLETAVWVVNQLAAIFAIIMAYRKDLIREYRYFCLYLGCGSLASAILFYHWNFSRDGNRYAEVFIGWGYVGPIFYLLAINEVLQLTLGRFPAVEIASRRILGIVWSLLAIFGVGWYFYLVSTSKLPFPALTAGLSYQQASTTGFALFILAFLAFVAFMPVPMTSVKLRHCFLLGGTFLMMGVSRLLVLVNTDFRIAREVGSYVGMLGSVILLVLWALKIDKDTPHAPLATPKGELDREEAEVYIARMEDLNKTVSRSGPRFLR